MSCLFPNCSSTKHFSKDSNVRFFKFPTIPYMRQKWLSSCNLIDSELPKTPLVCSLHFGNDDIAMDKEIVRLKKSAFPDNKGTQRKIIKNDDHNEEGFIECLERWHTEPPSVSRKIVRKTFTSVGTQTDTSLQDYRVKNILADSEIKMLKEKIATLEYQLILSSKNEKKKRYKLGEISQAICIYSAGPRCYKLLRNKEYLPLPSPSTLRRWAYLLCVEPGIQAQIIYQMRSFDMPLEEKLCVISFDEMKCREEWAYDRKNDIIMKPRRMVQVAMIRGLRGHWKQPVFYNFNFKMVQETLLQIIAELFKIGFTVVAAVSDLGPENQQLWKSMGISSQKPFFNHPCDENRKVYVFADVPHLIKLLRNHFADNGFLFKNKALTKFMVEELLSLCNFDLTITKTVTLEMLNVKGAARQKVKYATKLFSHTTATAFSRCAQLGICSNVENFLLCSELFQIINDWFDVFNIKSTQKDSRPLMKAYGLSLPEQDEVLKSMTDAVLKFFPNRASGFLLPFQRGILQNNNALPLFLKDLQGQYIQYEHPSPLEFKYRFRSYLLGRNDNILGNETNVMDSQDTLIEFPNVDKTLSQEIFEVINEIPVGEEEQMELKEEQESEKLWEEINHLNEIEFDGLENFSGYIVSKMELKEFGYQTFEGKDQNYTYVNELSEGGLYKPNKDFMAKMEKLNSTFLKINGSELYSGPNYMENLLCNSHLLLDNNVKRRFFLGRTFFRIRFLNKNMKQCKILYTNKKMKKTVC